MAKCNYLSLVVPCFNEEEVISETINRILDLSRKLIAEKIINDFEEIFIDDGSKDSTLSILKAFSDKEKKIKILSFSRNYGHQYALLAGLQFTSGDASISLDADLQDPIEIIPTMLEKYSEGSDIVFGVREKRKTDTIFKRFTAGLFYLLMKSFGVNIVADHADFRLLSRAVLDELKKYSETNIFLRGIIPSLGFNQSTVYYDRPKRMLGQTKYTLFKMLEFAIEGITSFSYIPLRLATVLGLLSILVLFVVSMWVIVTKLFGNAAPGWASILLPLIFLGSVQLLFLGIIGEYIGKIYLETKRRPIFIVKEKHNL